METEEFKLEKHVADKIFFKSLMKMKDGYAVNKIETQSIQGLYFNVPEFYAPVPNLLKSTEQYCYKFDYKHLTGSMILSTFNAELSFTDKYSLEHRLLSEGYAPMVKENLVCTMYKMYGNDYCTALKNTWKGYYTLLSRNCKDEFLRQSYVNEKEAKMAEIDLLCETAKESTSA